MCGAWRRSPALGSGDEPSRGGARARASQSLWRHCGRAVRFWACAAEAKGVADMARTRANAAVRCVFCNGQGRDPFEVFSPLSACPVCLGRGVVNVPEPRVRCAYCRGSGVHPHTRLTCSGCAGRGFQTVREPLASCPRCGGSGEETGSELHLSCLGCHGAGWVHDRAARSAPGRARKGRPARPRRPAAR